MKDRMEKKNGLMRSVALAFVICLLASVALAQTERDKDVTVLFRFVADRDMFYREGNEEALDSLFLILDPSLLAAGTVRVDGYSRTKALSKTRCNRVKSELITRRGLREEHFTTRNLTGTFNGRQNIVVVTVPISAPVSRPERNAPVADEKQYGDESGTAVTALTDGAATEIASPAEMKPAENVGNKPGTDEAGKTAPGRTSHETFSVRANLLRWATLTPDLGFEWHITPSWCLLVNGSWTSWSWDNKNRRYALWEVAPEVRYYIGKEKRGYIGAMYKAGHFNYKLSVTGRQGDIMGGGITGGYLLRLNKSLDIDFSLGVGCLHADYEKYAVIDGVRVRRGKETKNWWGPVSAGVSLVWTIF